MMLELDADSLVYKIGYIVDKQEGGEKLCHVLVQQSLDHILENSRCVDMNIYLGGTGNFRGTVATILPYKGNRDVSNRPIHYDFIREILCTRYGADIVHGQEAEDAVGIAISKYEDEDQYMVGGIDKDLLMLPGYHYNYNKAQVTYHITEEQGYRNFCLQLLHGDMTDNIPGIYQLLKLDGKTETMNALKKSKYLIVAEKELKVLHTFQDMLKYVIQQYVESGEILRRGTVRICEVAQLLWLRRYENEQFDLMKIMKEGY